MNRFLPVLALLVLSYTGSTQVLIDQSTTIVTGGIASQNFETASNLYDCEAVDDIIVPSGTNWTIDSILIYGQYSTGAQTVCPVTLRFYEDSAGTPGDLYYERTWTSDQDLDGDGDLLLIFDCPYELPSGRYWMSAQAEKTFGGGGGQWYWTRDSIGANFEFQWKNPPGGFGTSCSTFTEISTCVSTITEYGTAFIIYGCAGGPSIQAFGNDTTICDNEFLQLDPGTGGLSNPIFQWSTGDSTQLLQVLETGFYNVSVTDPSTGCYSASCINVVVNETPQANISNDTICEGQSNSFNGFANCGTCQYIWNDTFSGAFYTTNVQGWHYLAISNPNTGCSSLDSVWLEVESTAPPAMAPSPEVDLCEGDSAYLSVVDDYASYIWSTFEITKGIYVFDSGNYIVTVQTPNGCEASDTISVTLRPAPEPEIELDYTGSWKTRLTATSGYQSYAWSNGDDDAVIIVNSIGDYTVTVTDEFGCEGSVTFTVESVGINEKIAAQLRIYPNPADDQITVQWPMEWVGSAQIHLCDLSGREISTYRAQSQMQQMDVSTLAPGYYLLRIDSPEGEGIARVSIH